jgi:hypothetical protein
MASSEPTTSAHSNADAATASAHSDAHSRPGLDQERSAADQAARVKAINDLRFEATVNGRYHTSRQGWYEFMHRWCMFVVVVGGAGAVAEAVGAGRSYSWLIALIPTIAGTTDLVFDFSAKAAQHARLQEKSYEIIAEIAQSTDDAAVVCRRGWAAMARIWALEPKTMRVVQALAYNDTKEGTEKNPQGLITVSTKARLFKHVWPFDGMKLDPPTEVAAAAA